MAIALADGISSSSVSREASEAAVRGFLESYYDTSQVAATATELFAENAPFESDGDGNGKA